MEEIRTQELRGSVGEPHVGFQDLVPFRVNDILLVMSPYDRFILEQDGQLNDLALGQVLELNFTRTPGLTRVPTGRLALERLKAESGRYNLVIASPLLRDMSVTKLAREVSRQGFDVPVVVLGYDARHLKAHVNCRGAAGVEAAFLWQGDARIFPAIVNQIEDRWNLRHDCSKGGVQVVLVVEDNIRFYSAYLPEIYETILRHTRNALSEGLNLTHKLLRLRARPKVLLCTDLEDAEAALDLYGRHVLGVVADVELPRRGRRTKWGGIDFARRVKETEPDVPVLLQSAQPEAEAKAHAANAGFVLKRSPTLLTEMKAFLNDFVSLGDFVFRTESGQEVARARTLTDLVECIRTVDEDVLLRHGRGNHFSAWLRARTEFAVAKKLRPVGVTRFKTGESLRRWLLEALETYLWERHQAAMIDFDPEHYNPEMDFARIGAGSVGGKARGLAFVRWLLGKRSVTAMFPRVRISVPPGVVLGTEVFDQFMRDNELVELALTAENDAAIDEHFERATFPEAARSALGSFLDLMEGPLAVRSSSLLEDSFYQPFAGVYSTFLLPNDAHDRVTRLDELVRAVKKVYASTFHDRARGFLRATPYRLEEEKMAVAVMKLVGTERKDRRFYPDFAGVAQSWNFYAAEPLKPEDGVAAVVLGLGEGVTEGLPCRRFSPRHPMVPARWGSARGRADNSQRSFRALQLGTPDAEKAVRTFTTADAEADGTLGQVGSVWQPENDAIYDGLSRKGVRLVTFAPLLKFALFPLAEILDVLLELGRWGMNTPIEIEFAVSSVVRPGQMRQFSILQMRPLVVTREADEYVDADEFVDEDLICRSERVMGHGWSEVEDVVVVDRRLYDRRDARKVAQQLGRLNAALAKENRRFLLVGVGRWGSRDPWLGIPVSWDQISGARAIVETGFADREVEPSQGSHFFQNLAAQGVGYFTVNPERGEGLLDWAWLSEQAAIREDGPVRLLRFDEPITIWMNGRKSEGLVTRPGVAAEHDLTGQTLEVRVASENGYE